jgi:hypothetical protein
MSRDFGARALRIRAALLLAALVLCGVAQSTAAPGVMAPPPSAAGGRVFWSCSLGVALVASSIALFEANPALGAGLFGAGVHLIATSC